MRKTLYIDMDNTLVDFSARLDVIHPSIRERYEGRADEIPGLFALMPPVEGAVEAFEELATPFDTYILSTAPWENPSAWQHKVEWVHLHLGRDKDSSAYKRLILSHHKNLTGATSSSTTAPDTEVRTSSRARSFPSALRSLRLGPRWSTTSETAPDKPSVRLQHHAVQHSPEALHVR